MKSYSRGRGNTISECCILVGLLALVAVGALQLLGGSVSDLLGGFTKSSTPALKLAGLNVNSASPSSASGSGSTSGSGGSVSSAATPLSVPSVSRGPVSLKGTGYYSVVIDPDTGIPMFKATDTAGGGAKNSTGLDGSQWNTLGQFHLADTLMKLAKQQTDPDNAGYIQSLAEMSYYMAGAEGEIDCIPNLELSDNYGKVNGYADIQRFQGLMLDKLNNIPPGMDRQTMLQVMPLAADVYNIGRNYTNNLAPIAGATPSWWEFAMPSDARNTASGYPGQGLNVTTSQMTYCDPKSNPCGAIPQSMGGPSIENVFTVQQLRTVGNQVLNNYQVSTAPVKATFTDANQLDITSTTPSASP